MWDKLKGVMTDGMPDPKNFKPAPKLDPDKAKAFASVFNSDSDALSRRLENLKKSKDY